MARSTFRGGLAALLVMSALLAVAYADGNSTSSSNTTKTASPSPKKAEKPKSPPKSPRPPSPPPKPKSCVQNGTVVCVDDKAPKPGTYVLGTNLTTLQGAWTGGKCSQVASSTSDGSKAMCTPKYKGKQYIVEYPYSLVFNGNSFNYTQSEFPGISITVDKTETDLYYAAYKSPIGTITNSSATGSGLCLSLKFADNTTVKFVVTVDGPDKDGKVTYTEEGFYALSNNSADKSKCPSKQGNGLDCSAKNDIFNYKCKAYKYVAKPKRHSRRFSLF